MISFYFPRRVVVVLMIWVAEVINMSLKLNLSVNIVLMVPNSVSLDQNVSNIMTRDSSIGLGKMPESLGWSSYERGLVLSAISWGSIVGNVCGGSVVEYFGPRIVVSLSILLKAAMSIASPITAKTNVVAMVILRVLQGLCHGFIWPSVNNLIANWAPTFEKNKFFAFLEFHTISTLITWSLCGVIIDSFGWEWGFYAFGIVAIVFSISWWFLVYGSPDKHPYISRNEKQYIIDGTTGINKEKCKIPYVQIFTSIPMWATIIGNFGTGWVANIVYLSAPLFISSALHKDVKTTGILSSIIALTKPLCVLVFGPIADFLLERKLLSLRIQRKSFTLVSHILPGFVLLALAFTKGSVTSIVLFALFNGMNAAMTVTTSINALDLAPNFAGVASGICSGGMQLAGLISPMVVAHFTKDNETSLDAWRLVFITGMAISIVTGCVFIIFGSTDIQPWNSDKNVDNEFYEKGGEKQITTPQTMKVDNEFIEKGEENQVATGRSFVKL